MARCLAFPLLRQSPSLRSAPTIPPRIYVRSSRTLSRPFTVLGYFHLSRARSYKPTNLTARDTLTDLAKTRFDNHCLRLVKHYQNCQVRSRSLKWAKPRKSHGKASARAFTETETETAEVAADKAE